MLELRVLRYIVAVADDGGFQRAAARMRVAQPSLSRQVALAERRLGVRLFERQPTRPTPAGESFVASARIILHSMDNLIADVQATYRAAPGKTSKD
jgi:DNA-binding transcriptional LysR family regulator